MFIDTHCHIDSYEEQAKESFENYLNNFPYEDSKITRPKAFIHIACNPVDFEYAKNLSEKYEFVYAAYGIHPEYVNAATAKDLENLLLFLNHPKCVACGEFGLDYHYGFDFKKQQISLFERHLELGLKSKKPLVLHLREADDDALAILKNADLSGAKIHVHCFTGSPEFCEKLLDLEEQKNASIFIGFTGIVTFKSAQNVRDALKLVPLNKILLETDAPYMAPVPYRGKPCHSGLIPYSAEMISQVKEIPIETLYEECLKNTKNCYGI